MTKKNPQGITAQSWTEKLLNWFDKEKRSMPWRGEKDPYKILVSEIMLQQTRVDQAIPFYLRFIKRFPNIDALASAPLNDVLECWNGLGYYRRGKQLHQTVQILRNDYAGTFPRTREEWLCLTGIGRYTAGAILSIAFNLPFPAVDGNVARVMSRLKGLKQDIAKDSSKLAIEKILQEVFPKKTCGDFTQSLMELGACVCFPRNPLCCKCPLAEDCYAQIHHEQNLLPVKQKKTTPKKESWAVFLVDINQGVLLVERKKEALLSDFWGLPMLPHDLTEHMEIAFHQKYGLKIHILTQKGIKKYLFSHRSWELQIYNAILKTSKNRMKEDTCLISGDWSISSYKDQKNRNIAKIFQKILEEFGDK